LKLSQHQPNGVAHDRVDQEECDRLVGMSAPAGFRRKPFDDDDDDDDESQVTISRSVHIAAAQSYW
jgi:hypothetical protein